MDGASACTATVSHSATAYADDCLDCDFSFEFDSSAYSLDAGSVDDCADFPFGSTLLAEVDAYYDYYYGTEGELEYTPGLVAFWDTYTYEGYYGDYTYYNQMAVGFTVETGGDFYPGPYWSVVAADDMDDGSWSGEVAASSWSLMSEFDFTTVYSGEVCEEPALDDAVNYAADVPNTGSLPCEDDSVVDVWSVEATAGDMIGVSVDTVDAGTAFDPFMTVVGPDGCIVAEADDSFDCTFPPTDWQCSSTSFEAAETGTYTVVVGSYGSCTGTDGAYGLDWKVLD
jgi:hypothetical protein